MVSIEFETMSIEPAQKILRTRIAEKLRQQREMVGRHVVQFQRKHGLGIVAHQQWPRACHAPPMALLASRNLKIVELDRDRAVQKIESIDFTPSDRKSV